MYLCKYLPTGTTLNVNMIIYVDNLTSEKKTFKNEVHTYFWKFCVHIELLKISFSVGARCTENVEIFGMVRGKW